MHTSHFNLIGRDSTMIPFSLTRKGNGRFDFDLPGDEMDAGIQLEDVAMDEIETALSQWNSRTKFAKKSTIQYTFFILRQF